MFAKFVNSSRFGFLMAVAELYDKGMSAEEIAIRLNTVLDLVEEAIIAICRSREAYRISRY